MLCLQQNKVSWDANTNSVVMELLIVVLRLLMIMILLFALGLIQFLYRFRRIAHVAGTELRLRDMLSRVLYERFAE